MWWPWRTKQNPTVTEPDTAEPDVAEVERRLALLQDELEQLPKLLARIAALEHNWTRVTSAICGIPAPAPPRPESAGKTLRRHWEKLQSEAPPGEMPPMATIKKVPKIREVNTQG